MTFDLPPFSVDLPHVTIDLPHVTFDERHVTCVFAHVRSVWASHRQPRSCPPATERSAERRGRRCRQVGALTKRFDPPPGKKIKPNRPTHEIRHTHHWNTACERNASCQCRWDEMMGRGCRGRRGHNGGWDSASVVMGDGGGGGHDHHFHHHHLLLIIIIITLITISNKMVKRVWAAVSLDSIIRLWCGGDDGDDEGNDDYFGVE
eukprot:957303-Rhodomonas_salina.1